MDVLWSLSVRACLVALGMLALSTPSRAQSPAEIQQAVDAAYAKYRTLNEGKNADYIPALAKVDPNLFGIAVVTADGKVYTAGDVKTEVSIQSISKVFTMAQVIQEQGVESVEKRIGVDATGARFNSIIAVEGVKTVAGTGAPEMNPLVNPGAISATSMVTGRRSDAVWNKIIGFHNAAAGRQLNVLQDVYKSESDTNQRNQAIGALMLAVRLHQDRLAAGGRPLHAPVLDRRQRAGPGDDGGHAGRRRQESGHRPPGPGHRKGPQRPRRDVHRRFVRRLGEVALSHGASSQERCRRRHHRRIPGQVRHRRRIPAAR